MQSSPSTDSPGTLPPLYQFPDVDYASTGVDGVGIENARIPQLAWRGGREPIHRVSDVHGSTVSFRIDQMVQHLVNHSTYHRGQLTTMFRQLAVEPAEGMDLIGYYREQSVNAGG